MSNYRIYGDSKGKLFITNSYGKIIAEVQDEWDCKDLIEEANKLPNALEELEEANGRYDKMMLEFRNKFYHDLYDSCILDDICDRADEVLDRIGRGY